MLNSQYSTFISLLEAYVRGGCQINHNYWVYRQPLSISMNQEKSIYRYDDRVFFTVQDVVIFALKDFNFTFDKGDLIIQADQPELYNSVLYRIKKDPDAKSCLADLKTYLCLTVPAAAIMDPVTATMFFNLAQEEDELKKQVNAKKFEINQQGIYHAVYSDEYTTRILVPDFAASKERVIDYSI